MIEDCNSCFPVPFITVDTPPAGRGKRKGKGPGPISIKGFGHCSKKDAGHPMIGEQQKFRGMAVNRVNR